jgi:signal transduction histidine kinase
MRPVRSWIFPSRRPTTRLSGFALYARPRFWDYFGWYYEVRVRQLRQKFAMVLDARVNERTRIARELHDTLLQSFLGVLLKFDTVTEMLPDKVDEARKVLESTTEQARKAITEGRDVVYGLRSSTIVTNELARAIGKLGEELTAAQSDGNSTDFRILVEGTSRDIVPIIRDEIYRIACEALRNAFHHAHAGRIDVEIWYAPRTFRLRVGDNGRGIDAKVVAEGGRTRHYGLPGMQERARLVKGKLSVRSAPDSGTEVELTIPGSVAYVKSPTARPPLFFGKGA